jgi:4'-phosphopantetheinyl transferase EntD
MADAHSAESNNSWREDQMLGSLQAMFADKCGVACWLSAWAVPPAHETEAEAVANAVESRKREFAMGRAAAREALRKIGHPPVAIPVGEGRAPVWPAGTIGSIAHTNGMAVAVAGRTGDFLGLGVDIEETGAVTAELWPNLFVPAERAFLDSVPEVERARLATAMFAVKEALFKFQFPLTKEWVDFKDVELGMTLGSTTCRANSNRPLLIGGKKMNIFAAKFIIEETWTLAAVSLPK